MQFVLRYTKEGGSSTERMINHLKSKFKIHVIHEGEDDYKTIPAQEEIRSQIVKKKSVCLRLKRRGQITWKTVPRLTYNQAQIS